MHLLQRVESHLRRTGMTATGFGRTALNDPRLVHDLRRGRELRPRTAARIGAFLDRHEQGDTSCGR
jgi:2,4-dienoyl-CoA reductase-like NADH-dependent reductase (Old Yellow Enzyme family)